MNQHAVGERGSVSNGMRLRRFARYGVCAVEDCRGTTREDEYCPRCREEIDALEIWRRDQQARDLDRLLRWQDRINRLRQAKRTLAGMIWIPELLFVCAGLGYLMFSASGFLRDFVRMWIEGTGAR